eukprot:TRINITY_DN505_c0_g1_i1.p1 TRINITY_DN505_c0_g1~~TRINITY_DN505_c0_g1_i1.p1  ORF type:complete len:795 (-),score=278.66 TRINITY_DN505_c0_g1_i1:79-2463(-)
MSIKTTTLGLPRIGAERELKWSQEKYWRNEITQEELLNVAKTIRHANWTVQQKNKINWIPSNDFSFYDQVLDTSVLLGVVPDRYTDLLNDRVVTDSQGLPCFPLNAYFALARGDATHTAMEMTKWFDTNYHYIVPEFNLDTTVFRVNDNKIFAHFLEAKTELGIVTKPVLLGPLTYLALGKLKTSEEQHHDTSCSHAQQTSANEKDTILQLLPKLIPVYEEIFAKLKALGAEWIQIDEPLLACDLTVKQRQEYINTYAAFKEKNFGGLKVFLATYFEGLLDNLDLAVNLPVEVLHIDAVACPEQVSHVVTAVKPKFNLKLSLGLVEGRNIWRTNLSNAIQVASSAVKDLGSERVVIGTSCSLLHSPVTLAKETKLDTEIRSWLAFAYEKIEEVKVIAQALNEGVASVQQELDDNVKALNNKGASSRIHNSAVKTRLDNVSEDQYNRKSPYSVRKGVQQKELNLPSFPTTTIGSFPQTAQVRKFRSDFKTKKIGEVEYEQFLKQEIINVIKLQEELDIDVPVHGEFERNDMVEYFGEHLNGYTFTVNGWVQSYGSRCVKPPVIFGDVYRAQPITVKWSAFAQQQTSRPVKGMLTGPVTMLQWSFVRNDQPRARTCQQLALAIRDEVADLEKNGIKVIQIDEPALREGLPLRSSKRAEYLKWAVNSFKLSAAVVEDKTQIHTHMCYAEFNDIFDSIAALDADVISIEASRSEMELLNAFKEYKYPNDIGPGLWDIHSPRVPSQAEMELLAKKVLQFVPREQVWINPDCGLKTRGWEETIQSLKNLVAVAKAVRTQQ